MNTFMKLYEFEGDVYDSDGLLATDWEAKTRAVSIEQAAVQIKHQFRMRYGLPVNAFIELCGNLKPHEPENVIKSPKAQLAEAKVYDTDKPFVPAEQMKPHI